MELDKNSQIATDTLNSQGIKGSCKIVDIALFAYSQENEEALAVTAVIDFVINGGLAANGGAVVYTVPVLKDEFPIGHVSFTWDTFPLETESK
jgi:hypothetical protein